jgi:hypothetical protein
MLLCVFIQYYKVGIKMLELVAIDENLVWLRSLIYK